MNGMLTMLACVLFGAGLFACGAWWLATHGERVALPMTTAAPSEPVAATASAASVPAIRHSIAVAASSASREVPIGYQGTLIDLFDTQAMASYFRPVDFAHRLAATVDNLGRSSAPAGMWPMVPASGRLVATRDARGGEAISDENSSRYSPYITLLERVDLKGLVQDYVELYPDIQHAYEELGYPDGYFNDRLVDVLGLPISTPVPKTPLHVHLPKVAANVQPTRPWLLYEFDDPALASLSAGQQLLLRMGSENERRVESRLVELRRLLVAK